MCGSELCSLILLLNPAKEQPASRASPRNSSCFGNGQGEKQQKRWLILAVRWL